jgi:hypothetical protein
MSEIHTLKTAAAAAAVMIVASVVIVSIAVLQYKH